VSIDDPREDEMSRRLARITLALAAVFATAAALADGANAQKGVLGSGADPSTGVVDPDSGYRYTAINGRAGTLVAKLATDGGAIERYVQLDRRLVVPAVAWDGSAGGLSDDGETLVLAEPGLRFPQATSEFTVLGTDSLRRRATVTLPGTFTFDALSPDGRTLYLIEYTSPRDLTEYLVRAYDIERGRLDPAPIIDPAESSEDMYGSPVTRTTSPNGRWEYTLYDGAEYPFVHALNVARGTAVCIDLDPLADHRNVYRLELQPSLDGSTLSVVDRRDALASVELGSFKVSEPAPPPPPSGAASADGGSDWLAWAAIGGGAAALAGSAILIGGRRRRRAGAELERLVRVEGEAADEQREREREPVR
jgi:hypothetical protein